MAKAGKKADGGRNGAPGGARKAAPKRTGSKAAGAGGKGPAVVVETVAVEAALPVVGRQEAEDVRDALRTALAEVKELRDAVRAARAATDEARSAQRAALAETLDGIRRLRGDVESLLARAAEGGRAADLPSAESGAPEPVRKNRLGATVAPGVVVAEVIEGTPAAASGLERGDVIEEANGRPIAGGSDLRDAVEAAPAGSEVTLQLRRAGELLVRTVRTGDPANEGEGEGKSRFGVTVAPGVVVAEVFPDSPAAVSGLERGDVIEEVNGQPIASGNQLLAVVHALSEGATVPLVVTRAGERREVVAHLDGA